MSKTKMVKYTKPVITKTDADETDALRRIIIMRDTDPQNPREEWDNVFTIHSECSRYLSSDKGAFNPVVSYGKSPDEAKFTDGVCAFPFYAYIHSGIALSMNPFGCRWDSGCAGFIYVNKAKFCEEFGLKRFSRKRAYKIAEGEIANLNQYVNGEVFGYVEQTRATREDEWEDGDSCWGFFGRESIPYMLTDAGAYEKGTVVCEDDDANVGMDLVTMERAVTVETHTEVKAA